MILSLKKNLDVKFILNSIKPFCFHLFNPNFVTMKTIAQLLLFVFITFLVTPTIVSVIEKSADFSTLYDYSEKEQSQKEIKDVKIVFDFGIAYIPNKFYSLNYNIIHSENLSKHDKISSKIFIPPPEPV
jgi:hypothetical protein